jgi:cytochrome c-type biogenesis protein CcmH/NrfG
VVYAAIGRIWLEVAESGRDRVALDKALEALAPMADRPGATSDTLTLYGRALFLSGDVAAAEAVLRQAVERFPVAPRAFSYLAEAARRQGHVAAARDAEARHAALRSTER